MGYECIEPGIYSEVGRLEAVLLHTPGIEVERMTPQNAARALYSDILSLNVAQSEYAQLQGVLEKVTKVFQVKDLLSEVLENSECRHKLIQDICALEDLADIAPRLKELSPKDLAIGLLEGVPMEDNTLTNYLDDNRYALNPLHNFFFTRDASVTICDEILINKMASEARARESLIVEAIFDYSKEFNATTVSPRKLKSEKVLNELTIEGGDVLIARDDILIIGMGGRTTSRGVDFIIDRLKLQKGETRHILVQELPLSPESFIHLDMVFTLLDKDACMVFKPLILDANRYRTIHILIEDGKVNYIREETNLLTALEDLGMKLKPILCGDDDPWNQEREQWHSGANFFAVAPGKVIGYARNSHTVDALAKEGFEVVPAEDIISGQRDFDELGRAVITIQGSELSRGGGGARCMTMPIKRAKV